MRSVLHAITSLKIQYILVDKSISAGAQVPPPYFGLLVTLLEDFKASVGLSPAYLLACMR